MPTSHRPPAFATDSYHSVGLRGGARARVPGLRGVRATAPYFHDGSAATVAAAVERVTSVVTSVASVTFTAEEKAALVEYLKSL